MLASWLWNMRALLLYKKTHSFRLHLTWASWRWYIIMMTIQLFLPVWSVSKQYFLPLQLWKEILCNVFVWTSRVILFAHSLYFWSPFFANCFAVLNELKMCLRWRCQFILFFNHERLSQFDTDFERRDTIQWLKTRLKFSSSVEKLL